MADDDKRAEEAELLEALQNARVASSTARRPRRPTQTPPVKPPADEAPPCPTPPPVPADVPEAPPSRRRASGGDGAPEPWDVARLLEFLSGAVTLGDVEGVGKSEQDEIAKTGLRLLAQGRFDDAKTIFTGLVALDPRDAFFHLALGAVAHRAGALDDAELAYSRAVERDEELLHAYVNRGEVRLELGRVEEGAEDLVTALELGRTQPDPVLARARALLDRLHVELRPVLRRERFRARARPRAGARPGAGKRRRR